MGTNDLQEKPKSPSAAADLHPIEFFLRPRSVAVVNVMDLTHLATPSLFDPKGQPFDQFAVMGARVLANLDRFHFAGDVHLVTRHAARIGERVTVPEIDDLPLDVDLATIWLPRDQLEDAVARCAARKVKAAVLYTGFADAQGEAILARIVKIARDAGMVLLGPGTVGASNFIDGFSISQGNHKPIEQHGDRHLGIIASSGGVSGQTRLAMESLDLPLSYSVCPGSEAMLGVDDVMDFMVGDRFTDVIAVVTENIRKPAKFLACAARARLAGKPVILLHPGRSSGARGLGVEGYDAMRALAEREGVHWVETMEALYDAAELHLRFPDPRPAGAGTGLVIDGGVGAILRDYAEEVGMPIPQLSENSIEALAEDMPAVRGASSNPVEISNGLMKWQLYGTTAGVLLKDPKIAAVMIAIMPGPPDIGLRTASDAAPLLAHAAKPVVYVMFGDSSPLHPDLIPLMRRSGIMYRRSTERATRALAGLFAHDRAVAAAAERAPPAASALTSIGDVIERLAAAGLKTGAQPGDSPALSFPAISFSVRSFGGWGPVVRLQPIGGWAGLVPAWPTLPADLTATQAADMLGHARGARGLADGDLKALGEVVSKIGALARGAPELSDIDGVLHLTPAGAVLASAAIKGQA